jgi:hypothetical protein
VKAVKGVKFAYHSTPLTLGLLSTFREMVNDAIRICLAERVEGRLKLRDRIYREFQGRYQVASVLPYSVAEVAWSIVRKHKRWHRKPYARKLMFKMDAASFSLNYSVLSLPFRKGGRVLVPLEYGEYQRSFLMDKTLKRGSVTVTESSIVIAFSRRLHWRSRREGWDTTSTKSPSSEATGRIMTSPRRRGFTLSTGFGARSSMRGILMTGGSGRSSQALDERRSG